MRDAALQLAAVGIGGAVGAALRHAVGLACVAAWGSRFGHATLLVNVAGCFALGVLMHEAWLADGARQGPWHTGLTVGLLGGLTTFSTFGYQTVRHLESGEPVLALANVALNVLLGVAAAAAGITLARAWWPAG